MKRSCLHAFVTVVVTTESNCGFSLDCGSWQGSVKGSWQGSVEERHSG